MADSYEFAGFTFPKQVAMIPTGKDKHRRFAELRKVCGPYYNAPAINPKGSTFYLDSDFMPIPRWQWCDEVEGNHINHTGWFTDDDEFDKIRGVVFRLNHGRGFVPGWSMGKSMASFVEYDIYDDAVEAANRADRLAERVAEDTRDSRDTEEEE